jgi:hypothetical protein
MTNLKQDRYESQLPGCAIGKISHCFLDYEIRNVEFNQKMIA